MCKLVIAIKQEGKNDDFKDAVRAQFNSMRSEHHGIGALIRYKDGSAEVMRRIDEDDYSEVYGWIISNINRAVSVSIHTRTASTGETCLRNCHFFEQNGVFMAHNGFAGLYKKTKTFTWNGNNDWDKDKKTFFGKNHKVGKQDGNTLTLQSGSPSEAEYNNAGIVISSCGECAKAHNGYCKKHKREGKLMKRFEGVYYTEDELIENSEPSEEEQVNEALEIEAAERLEKKDDLDEDDGYDQALGKITITDSEQWLKTLTMPITVKSLRKDVIDGDLAGMVYLFDKTTESQWLIVKKKCYVMLGKDFALFSSYDPQESLKEQTYNEVCGVLTDAGEKKVELKIKKHSLIEGVYELNDWK